MNHRTRLTLFILAVVILAASPFAYLDYQAYWQHRAQILNELATMPGEDRHPPAAVSSMVERYFGFDQINVILARDFDFEFNPDRGRILSREFRELSRAYALKLHLSREERMALFCHRMQFDSGTGMSEASRLFYGKSPDQLNDLEIAGLVAAELRPHYASPSAHPDRFEAERRKVLERVAGR